MSEAAFARVDDVVWRLASDRIIARHAMIDADEAGVDLAGLAAMVWVALDEPGSAADIVERLANEDVRVAVGDVEAVVYELVDTGWARRSDGRGITG